MSRILHQESGSTIRNRFCREIVLSIRKLILQSKPDDTSKDIVAFIILSLEKINQITDQAVAAWEKKDYWVKADKFKMQWSWAEDFSQKLTLELQNENWANIALLVAQIGQKLSKFEISPKNRIGEPWVGAFNYLNQKGD